MRNLLLCSGCCTATRFKRPQRSITRGNSGGPFGRSATERCLLSHAVKGGRSISTRMGEHMSYAIVGFGKIGQALAHAFARKNMNVTVTSRRSPEELAPRARAIGPTVTAKS